MSRSPHRIGVHDPRILDAIFALGVVLLGSDLAIVGRPPEYTVPGVAALAVMICLWIWWRVRRARSCRSWALAVGFALIAAALFLLVGNVSSLGIQWVAVLLLTFELGVAGSVTYLGVICTLTFGVHVFVAGDVVRGLAETLGAALLLGLGIEFALLIRRGERVDAERVEALAQLELANAELGHANAVLERANAELRRQRGRDQDLVLAEERARIATDLHDGLGHRLTAIGMSLDFSDRMRGKDPERAAAEVRTARATATEALDEMRRVVRAMHPVSVDAGDVAGSLGSLADSFASTGLDVSFVRTGSGPIEPDVGLLLLRAVQEGLTNVVRHANATRAELHLEQRDREVRIAILDDGTAPAPLPDPNLLEPVEASTLPVEFAEPVEGTVVEGFGIRTLRERAEQAGGTLDVRPGGGLDGGFALSMTLPNGDADARRAHELDVASPRESDEPHPEPASERSVA